ncbi:protein-tyrosine phosphatase-like protein, partial [Coemansia spiralis]
LTNSFSLIEYDHGRRFLIMDCPTNSTISLYLKEFARLNVTDVVRVCEPTYLKERLETHNVRVHDLPFKDGDVPPSAVLKQWLELVNDCFNNRKDSANEPVPTTIAVHCVAGLGRAPVLVAVALIERGMDPLDAIEHVRNKRRGAFNNRQITYLADHYKR